MNIDDLLLENLDHTPVYEDDIMKVVKIIKEIPSGSSKYVKRVQLVVWKSKNTDVPDLDIRTYSYKHKRYFKGITLSSSEAKMLYASLKDYFN